MTRPRSILLATPWYPNPAQPMFGIFCRDNALALARAGHTVRVLQIWHTTAATTEAGVARVGYPATPYGALAIGSARASGALLSAVRRGGIDVIHAHVLFPVGFAAAIVGRATGVPVLLTEHLGPFMQQVGTPLRRLLARWTLRNVAAVIPVSRALANQMSPYLDERVPLRVVPNTVDSSIFARDVLPPPRRDRVVYVGRLAPEKRVEDAIEALGLLRQRRPAATLRLVGDGPERPRLARLIETLGLEAAVELAGFAPRERVAADLAASDLVVLPSARENNPCALLEALVAGRPAVTTAWAGAEEIVTPEAGAIAPIADPRRLAEAMNAVLEREPAARRLSAWAVERWGYAALARQLGDLYEASLARAAA